MSGATPLPDLGRLRRLVGPGFDAVARSGAAVVVTDPTLADNPIVFVNAAFTRLTGYRFEQAVGRNCRFLQGPRTDSKAVDRFRVALERSDTAEIDILNHREDGTPFWNGVAVTPIRDGDGRVLLHFAIMADVTDRHGHSLKGGAAGRWEWDIPAERLYADARFCELCGLDPREGALGLPTSAFTSAILPEDRMRVRIAVAGVLHGAEVFARDYRVVDADGAVTWVSARGRGHMDEAGQPLTFTGLLTDVTEQKRIEAQLRVAQTAGGVGTFEYIAGFGTASVSEQFCRLLGLHAADALPVRTINAVVHAEDPPIIDAWVRNQGGERLNADLRIRRADTGEERWLTRRGELVSEGGSTGVRFVGAVYDITEAKRAEAKLREFARTLEQRVEERTQERDLIWNLSRDLFGICGFDGVYTAANPAWTTVLGVDAVGERYDGRVHPDDAGLVRAAFEDLTRGQASVRQYQCRMRAADGAWRWVDWAVIAESGAIFAVGRDITQRRQLEDQLHQSQKMEAVGRLTGGLAHDFNNMLTGIIGGMDIVRRRVAEGRTQDIERFIEAASASAHRAAALTHRLLAFSRRQSLDSQSTDVNLLVESMEDLLRRTLGEQVALDVVLATETWPAFSDPNQLESAVLNLAINARDAMPGGGGLVIETGNASLDADYAADHEGLLPGDYVVIRVSDTGMGMAPDVIAKVFDPFFTTKPIGQGTGLGLSMVHGFVKQTGGHVTIESAPGKGTAISLYLPRFSGAAAAGQESGAPSIPAPRGAGETVLVVEDDLSVRMLVMEVLRELGYAALEAPDADAALALLQTATPIDLLITDVGLPGMNGRQLAEMALARRPTLRVLFMTGYAENAAVRSEFLAPGMEMIGKPFAMDALAVKIREMLGLDG